MAVIKFAGQSGRDGDNEFAASSRLVNCYREPIEGRAVIKSVLGSEAFVDLGAVFLRAMRGVGGSIYAACGGTLYRITTAGGIEIMGAVNDGDTTISSNNGVVCIAAGGEFYTLDGATLTAPTGAAFDAVGSVAFVGQFTILTEQGGRRVAWSTPGDPTAFDGLDFASAEGRDDDILRAVGLNGMLVIFKETSRETWYQTGDADSTLAFQRTAGGVIDTGLLAYDLLAELDQAAFFVGDDGVVYLTDGASQQAISNRAVETSIKNDSPQRCVYYEDEGHKIACITFSGRPAWCYDMATGEWHERESYGLGEWPVVATVKVGSQWYSGTNLGEIRKMSRVNADASDPLVRKIVSNTLYMDGKRFRLAEFEVFGRIGKYQNELRLTALLSDLGLFLVDRAGDALQAGEVVAETYPITCALRLSDDGGITWGNVRHKSLGEIGDYDTRVNWRTLGQFRQVTAELSWSAAGEISFRDEARIRVA
jgi:hypothetical protein